MAAKRGPPPSETGRAQAAKERALAGLRLMQLHEKRREWRRVVDAALAGALAVIRDRLMAIPDRMSTLTAEQRQALRQEITDALEAWNKTRFKRNGPRRQPQARKHCARAYS
jgi:hypothetical protein